MPNDWNALPILLNIKETAEVTRYGQARIRELCNAGKMPHIRLGRAFMIPRDSLRTWIDRQAGGV